MPPPGVVATETERVTEGRFILPMEKIRFVKAKPQKIGGNIRVTSTPMSGTPRATLGWRDFSQNIYVSSATYRKLYAFDSSFALNDITPIVSSGTLGNNPFTTSSGSSTVTVHQLSHGVNVGDTSILSGATTFNGVTMNGTFLVGMIVDLNNYTITATTMASGSGAGGGAAVAFQYEIGVGTELGAYGQGWGVGPYGLGTWGTARSSSVIFFEPRVWSLDHFGVILMATYNGGTLWTFDPTQQQPWPRAVNTFNGTPMDHVPTDFRSMFITPERYIVGLCDKMVVKVCNQNDPNTWMPGTTNSAFQRTLQEGTKLVGGEVLAPFISLIWSDSAVYVFQYTGSQFVYNSSLGGKDCGLIAPNAAATVDGIAYWMGSDNFYTFNGTVSPMNNVEDIRQYVFPSIPPTLAFQCTAVYIPKYHEIWWFYPTTGDVNPTKYVVYHINDGCWSLGTANFYSSLGVTAGRASGSHFTQGDTSPLMAGTDGFLYNHDPVGDTFNDNGNPLTWTLSVSPIAKSEGLQNLDVEGVLWDFFQQSGNITATVTTFDRLTDITPMDSETEIYPASQGGLTDYRLGGRYVGVSLSSSDLNNYMRLGKPVIFVRPSARRR